MAAIAGNQPFIMKPDGLGWLYAPSRVKDGPLPTHYEPIESPVGNLLYPQADVEPDGAHLRRTAQSDRLRADRPSTRSSPRTFRLTEHYLSGPMSRFNSWLNELQPEMFVELSPELAAERGIEHAGWLTVSTPRGHDRGARDGHAAAAAAAARTVASSTRSACRSTGRSPARASAATPTT